VHVFRRRAGHRNATTIGSDKRWMSDEVSAATGPLPGK
jgi:hypothetical protein